jgi:hypothetical protein
MKTVLISGPLSGWGVVAQASSPVCIMLGVPNMYTVD